MGWCTFSQLRLPIEKVTDVANVGDELLVMVTGINEGKIRLSRQAVLEGWTLEEAQAQDAPPSGGGRRGSGGGGARGRRNG